MQMKNAVAARVARVVLILTLFVTAGFAVMVFCSYRPAASLWEAIITQGRANYNVREEAHKVPVERLASASFDIANVPFVDWRGNSLEITDRTQLAQMMDALRSAACLIDFGVSNEVDELVLRDANGEELTSFTMSVNSSFLYYGYPWDAFLQGIKQDQSNQLAVAVSQWSASNLVDKVRVTPFVAEGATELSDPAYSPPPPAAFFTGRIKPAKTVEEVLLTDASDRKRLLALLQSRNRNLFAYEFADTVALRVHWKTRNEEKTVVVVLPLKQLHPKGRYVLLPALAPDKAGRRLLSALAPLIVEPVYD